VPRFLLFLLLVASVVLVNTTPVRACSYEKFSDEQLFAKASAIFVAHVTRTEEATGASPLSGKREVIVEGSFRVIETLKGQAPADGKVKSPIWSNGNCGVLLVAAVDYLFFLHDDNYVLIPGGSRSIVLDGAESVETSSLLQGLRALSDKAK
jgi:hypothetical protein